MPSLKELREQRNDLISDVQKRYEALDKDQKNPGEEDFSWLAEQESRKADLDKQIGFLEARERFQLQNPPHSNTNPNPGKNDRNHNPAEEEKRERKEGPSDDPEIRNKAMKGWFLRQAGREVSEECVDAAKQCGIRLNSEANEFRLWGSDYRRNSTAVREKRAQSNLNLVLGGATVPEGFVTNIETALLAYGGMRDAANVMRTDSGNPLPWPTVNDTTNKGSLIAENTQVSTTDLSFGTTTLGAYKYTSNQVLIPVELLQDSAFNLEQYAGEMLGIRLARKLNDDYTTGTGASQPNGIATAATSGRTSTVSTAISMDDVIELIHSVDPAYRPQGAFMCHDLIKKALRQLKDGFGQYLWSNGDVQGGIPDRLYGYPIITNQSMDSTISSGKKTLFFGQWNKFVIREVAGIRLVVMRERYADYDQIGMVAFMRADSNLLDAGTHPIKYMTH